jgi:hypothetical protein
LYTDHQMQLSEVLGSGGANPVTVDSSFPFVQSISEMPDKFRNVLSILNEDESGSLSDSESDSETFYCEIATHDLLAFLRASGMEAIGASNSRSFSYLMRRSYCRDMSPYPISQTLFMESMHEAHRGFGGKTKFEWYAPSPITNMMILALDGRCPGTYFFSRSCSGFLTSSDGSEAESQGFSGALNAMIPDLNDLFNRDVDFLGKRKSLRTHSGPNDPRYSYEIDPWLCPSLFESELASGGLFSALPKARVSTIGFRQQSREFTKGGRRAQSFDGALLGSNRRPDGRYLAEATKFDPEQYFNICITPYGGVSVIFLTYPIICAFANPQQLTSADFSMRLAASLVVRLKSALASGSVAPQPVTQDHLQQYWGLAGTLMDLGELDRLGNMGPLAKGYIGGFNKLYERMGVKQPGKERRRGFVFRVPPLDWTLAAIDSASSG